MLYIFKLLQWYILSIFGLLHETENNQVFLICCYCITAVITALYLTQIKTLQKHPFSCIPQNKATAKVSEFAVAVWGWWRWYLSTWWTRDEKLKNVPDLLHVKMKKIPTFSQPTLSLPLSNESIQGLMTYCFSMKVQISVLVKSSWSCMCQSKRLWWILVG